MSKIVLGVDGGGTKTEVAIVDESGTVIGSGTGGPSNYDDVGIEEASANIQIAVERARAAAGIPRRRFDAAFLGMAGVVSALDRATIKAMAKSLDLAAPEHIGVDHDCRIALAGGLSGRPGIVQIAGTGSSTYGRTADGSSWRSGGWGELLADEGSGYWLGAGAMQAAVQSYDGRIGATSLLPRVLQHLELDHIDDIMHRVYVMRLTRSEIAAMGRLALDAARDGDAVAIDLIARGTELLAACVEAVAKRLKLEHDCELALVGGVFRAGDLVLKPMQQAVAARLPGCRIILAEQPPVMGAALLALENSE